MCESASAIEFQDRVHFLHGAETRDSKSRANLRITLINAYHSTTMAEAEALARRKKIRAGRKASATRTLGQIGSALAETPPDADRLSLLKLTLNEKLDTLKGLNSEIIEITPEDGLEDEIQQSDKYKERTYDALTRINRAINRVATPSSTVSETRASTPTTDRGAKIKPKLSLPHFNGDLTKWTSFWDSYESPIHSSTELTDVDKFNYLRSKLERTARNAIAGLTLSSENEAIDILLKRFGKQLIISRHMVLLLNVEAVPSDQNVKALRRLYDTIKSHIRSLKSLGVESASYGALLSSVLLNKLPPDICLIVSRKVASSELDMDSLIKAFEEELAARERASNSSYSQPHWTHDRRQHTPTSALLSKAPESGSGVTCCYCQQLSELHVGNQCWCTEADFENQRLFQLSTQGLCWAQLPSARKMPEM